MSPTIEEQIEGIKRTIAEMETQRESLGDEFVETSLVQFQQQLSELVTMLGERELRPAEEPILQRKLVTLLFMDIAGSTSVAQNMDPEDVREVFDMALKKLARPVEEFAGRVTRFMGDGFLAVFGAPIAREDDPERAVRAGLDIIEASHALGHELEENWGIPSFQLRVGINTGLVALGGLTEANDTLMGSPVNLTQRLQSAAPVGGLLISHDTYRHIRGVFDLEPWEPMQVKGFDDAVQVYRVLRAKKRTLRPDTRGVEGVETRMVGREAEIKYLEDAYHLAIEEGEGQIITITGEAGIGKSRLLYEFQNWLELRPPTMRFFQGGASQSTQITSYSLIRDVFSFRFQIQDSDPLSMVHQKIEAGFGEFFGMDDTGKMRSHVIGQLLGFDFHMSPHLVGLIENPKQLHERAAAYINQYFQELCQHEPGVIFLEDIHWADDNSLEIINSISRFISNYNLLIICLARSQLFDRRPHWGEGLVYHHRIELHALNKLESRRLVGEILQKVVQIPVALREMVVSWAEGNPFFIEELIKMLIDRGVIAKGPESWYVLPEECASFGLPATLTGVLQARLDSLPGRERAVLDLAAVIGRTFWDQAVKYLLISSSSHHLADLEVEINEALSALRERELIFRREDASFKDTCEYIFKHALLHEVAYENITKRERRIHHKSTADWLKKMAEATGRREEYAAQIADHYLNAKENSAAADWLYLAGQRAMKQDAMQEARSYFSKALDLISNDDIERRWGILLKRDEVLGILGDRDARVAEDENLVEIAETSGDDNKLAEAYYRKGFYLNILGQYRKSLNNCQIAVEAARRAGNRKLEIETLSIVVINHKYLGEIDTAFEIADYVLEVADEHLDEKTLAITLSNLGAVYEYQDIQKGIQLSERSVELCDCLGNNYLMTACLLNIGYSYTMAGHADQGVKALQKALELNDTIGSPRHMIYTQLNLGLAHYRLGDQGAAVDVLTQAASAIRKIEDPFADAYYHAYSGLVAEQDQQLHEAREHFDKAARLFKQLGCMGYVQDAVAGLARVEISMQELTAAHQHAGEVWDYLSTNGPEGMEFPILAYLTCARTFQAAQAQEKLAASIKAGYDELTKRADKFSDQGWRRIYLKTVPEHSEMLEMWNKFIENLEMKGDQK